MDAADTERIEHAFQKVLGKNYTDVNVHNLIECLSDNNTKHINQINDMLYMNYFNLLEPLNINTNKKLIFKEDTDNTEGVVRNNGKNHIVTNIVDQAGKGTYGTTYKAQTKGYVFKKIVFPGDTDEKLFNFKMFCRNTFLESFIQTVLSCDESEHSKNVCKIIKMYKDSPELHNDKSVLKLSKLTGDIDVNELLKLIENYGTGVEFISMLVGDSTTLYIKLKAKTAETIVSNINRGNNEFKKICGENANIQVSIDTNPLTDIVYISHYDKLTFYIQLEPLTSSFHEHLIKEADKTEGRKLSYEKFINNYLRPLTETLAYYNKKYTFYHNDLHYGNILFKNNNIKIIDFGLSCLNYNGNTYSNYETTRGSCVSSDLGVFLVSVIQYLENFLMPEALNNLKGLLTINDFSWKKIEDISIIKDKKIQNKYDNNIKKWMDLSRADQSTNPKPTHNVFTKFHILYTWTGHTDEAIYKNIRLITPDFILSKLTVPAAAKAKAGKGGGRKRTRRVKRGRSRTRRA
jgi:hypothetical protein